MGGTPHGTTKRVRVCQHGCDDDGAADDDGSDGVRRAEAGLRGRSSERMRGRAESGFGTESNDWER
eukprot:2781877-Pyramimonas_sp.AAC.1